MVDRALLIVDLQNDFLPGGALTVPRGDEIVDVINRLQARFELVVASQDWHPPDHVSFAANHPGRQYGDIIEVDGHDQILWPTHCVQNTAGAELSSRLDTQHVAKIIHKGTDPRVDSYSAFFDNAGRGTGLMEYLRGAGVTEVFLTGLATDYCVAFSARDALRLGFAVHLIVDACRGIDLRPGDVADTLSDLEGSGVHLRTSSELLDFRPPATG
jgi:nicotinamidase/pyrazinamidase